jgi:hypothetical protein
MMQSYSGDFLNAIDGMRALLGCKGRVWPVTVQQASVCAEYGDGSATRGEVEVDAGQSSGQFVRRIWLEPQVSIHPAVSTAVTEFEAAIIGPGSFYTSLMPIFLVSGTGSVAEVKGPIILIANLLTEGAACRVHGRRRRQPHRGSHSPQDRRRRTNTTCRRQRFSAGTRSSTRSRSPSAACRIIANWSVANSGPAISRVTIGAGWRMRCGACYRAACCRTELPSGLGARG